MNQTAYDLEHDLIDALQPDEYTPDQPESWQPNTIDEVDWCAQKAAQADAEYQQAVAAARRQQDKIQAWLAEAKTKRDDRVGFFEVHAAGYLARLRAQEAENGVKPDKLTKTLKLPGGGKVQARQQPDRFDFEDEQVVIAWARENGADNLVRVKESVSKTDLAKHVKATGEIPEGVEIVPGETKLSLTLPEAASD